MKKSLRILALALFALNFSASFAQTTSYGRSGQDVTLDLNWTGDNYGTVQWQKSTDNGATWTDINNATNHTYTFKVSGDEMYRAHVVGDPSCPPINLERKIKAVNFTTSIETLGYNSVEMAVSGLEVPAADVVEYGYATNFSALSRTFDMMPLNKVGDSLPEGDFTMICGNLRPNTGYSIRFYFKTVDGSVVFGPGKLATTIPGIEFSSEDWIIEKKRLRAEFMLSGNATANDVACYYGTTLDDMKAASVTSTSTGHYRSSYMSSLTPGTPYYIKIKARVDGDEQEVVHVVKTLTDYSTYEVDNTVLPVSHKINWGNPRTLTKISAEGMGGVEYPRICRLDDQTLLLTYHGGTSSDHWQNCYYRLSYDNGKTWGAQKMIFDKSKTFLGSSYFRICNPQATLLDNGWVILSATANGNSETNTNCKVICTISKDGCHTWSDPIIVGRGRTWEPHVVQLPGGELELLVSSEAQWWQGPGTPGMDQEIVVARSTDYGETWSEFKRASYLSGARDGMPVSVVMQGNKGVLFTIESPAGNVPPSIVHRELKDEWETTGWDRADDAKRWASGLNRGGGAPYCVQLPTGEFVMMCHTNQAGSVWQTNRPQVCLTDNTGHNPKYITLPVTTGNPLKSNEGAYYNSLFLKDAKHIWLLVTRAEYNGDKRGASSIEYIEGTIIDL